MSQVLLVAPPFAGHLYPLIALGKRLREHHEVSFATGPAKIGLLTELGFKAHAILPGDPDAMERIADTDQTVGHHPLRLARQLRANLALLSQVQDQIAALIAQERSQLVLADFTAPVAGWAAQRAGVGWITTTATPLAIETRHGTPSYCGGWAPPRNSMERARDAAGRLGVRAFKTAAGAFFAADLARLGTGIYRGDGSEAIYSPDRILGLGLPELEFKRDWPTGFSLIGPVTESPQAVELPAFLGRSGRRVLVTLGTHLPWARQELLDQVHALSQRHPDLEFVVSSGRPGGGATQISNRIWLCDYLPYDQVLPHFDAVIHHGGAGISYSTLRAGLPALVWPHDYDQPDFAARLVRAGTAIRVGGLASPAASDALSQALAGLPGVARLQAAVLASDPFAAATAAVATQLES